MHEKRPLDRSALEEKLTTAMPDNVSRDAGYTLVNVLPAESFAREHIPGSINIPLDDLKEFEERFSKSKEIILYCASPECDASPRAARELENRGFRSVLDYANGLSDWKSAGNRVVSVEQ